MTGFLLYQIAAFLAAVLPVSVSSALARRIAMARYAADRKMRKTVERNLARVFEERPRHASKRKIEKQVFGNFGCFVVDFLRASAGGASGGNGISGVEGLSHAHAALGKKRGLVIATAHLGNWELGASSLAKAGFRLKVIARPHRDRRVNSFFNARRAGMGVEVLDQSASMGSAVRWLKSRGCLGVLADREFGGSGTRATFFGREALFPRAHVVLAMRTGAPLLTGFTVREKDGRYRVTVQPEVLLDDLPKNRHGVRTGVERCLRALENAVSLHPEQWFVFDEVWASPESADRLEAMRKQKQWSS